MKKSIRNLIIGAVMTAGVFASSTAAFAGITKFVQTDMNFRMSPSTTATVIGSVPAGAKVEILGLQGEWDVINYNGTVGFIHTGNVADTFTATQNIVPAAQTTVPAQAAAQSQPAQAYASVKDYYDNNFSKAAQNMQNSLEWKTVSVNAGFLALRTAPAYEDANIIAQLNNGDVVQVFGEATGSYVQVYSPRYDAIGWVNAGFLR